MCQVSALRHGRAIVEAEQRALDRVFASLRERFPRVPDEIVHRTIHAIHDSFIGAPFCSHIPLLVERAARDELSHWLGDRDRTVFPAYRGQ